jgi:D-arginine dehydrogenase
MSKFDFLVVGAGIAGVSVAAHLAQTHTVILVEMEDRTAWHTTGRSAASYEPNYGPAPVLALTRASKGFFDRPPPGFADAALFTPRGTLVYEAEGQAQRTARLLSLASGLEDISVAAAMALFPPLRADQALRCFHDHQTGDLDVDLIHGGYLRLLKARGGVVLLSAPLKTAQRQGGQWQVTCGDHVISATTIVNAAGAWGDVVASLCGAMPVGLIPKRRSIGVVPMPDGLAFQHWPMVMDVGETWYCKPQSGKLIVSSADATPVEPHDAWADDMAIAEGIDRMMTATTLEVERLDHSWGGLRTFAPDGNPVVGFDPRTDGFFWLVGQGGYGIQSAPALSEAAANLARYLPIAPELVEGGLIASEISPNRFST